MANRRHLLRCHAARPTSARAAQRSVAYVIDRRSVPLDALRSCAAIVPDPSQGQSADARWRRHRLRADRPKFHRAGLFPPATVGRGRGIRGASSGGTNLAPANPKLKDGAPDDPKTADADESFAGIRQLTEEYRKQNELAPEVAVPIDAVTRSGSGLDPHISPANAALQIPRVSRAAASASKSCAAWSPDTPRAGNSVFSANPGWRYCR